MKQQYTLFELNQMIKGSLQEAFPATVWIVAEVSELKENRSGHCYLELVEKLEDEIIARSRATIWSYTYRMLKPYFETTTGQFFSHGIKIMVQVTVEYHPAYGLSLNIKDIDPTYTVGDMALQRKEIVERLMSEGVVDMNRELQLPLVPQKIAVISSKTAAGYQDFINQLENNSHGFKFYTHLFEAYMQGQGAVASVINALERIFQYEDFFDAVAIIRGGGATADLSCFDNYELAFNITQFPLPVVTGIGHEKDETVIDLVAHTRMKTPTAVAEFFINGVELFYDRLLENEAHIVRLTRGKVDDSQYILEKLAGKFEQVTSEFIRQKKSLLARKGNQLQRSVGNFVFNKNSELSSYKYDVRGAVSVWSVETKNMLNQKKRLLKRLSGESLMKEDIKLSRLKDITTFRCRNLLNKEKERIHLNENAVRLLAPDNILKRGYTLTLKDGKIIKSIVGLNPNDEIETRFADGKVKSKISNKTYNGN